jgi:hypothetical protein
MAAGKRRAELLVELLVAYKPPITLLLAGAAGAVYAGVIDAPAIELPSVGRELKLLILAGLASAILGWIPASKVVKWLYSPEWTYLLETDARENDIALYKLSPQQWADLEVLHGELYQLQASVAVYEARAYVPDRNTAIGTWRGSASDMELIQERERIDEIRETLELEAQRGLSIRMKISSIVRTAVANATRQRLKDEESVTMYSGESIERAVQEAISEEGLSDEIEQPGDGPNHPASDQRGADEAAAGASKAATNGGEPAETAETEETTT